MPIREGRRKPVARRSSFHNVALLMLIPVGGFVLFFGYCFFRDQLIRTPPARQGERAAVLALPHWTVVREPHAKAPLIPRGPSRREAEARSASIALILDDVGFDHQPLARAMRIDPHFDFSILPNSANASAFAETLHRNGFEVLCHLPMEPLDYPRESPGANAIMTSMDDNQIAELTRQDIARVPHAAGVNNHMGSRATRDPRVMSTVLGALPHGMFFIDSRTTTGSVGESTARELKIRTGSRHVFLDDVQSETAVRQQLASLVAAARRDGVAIGIGHMYPVTIKVLADEVPNLRAEGIRFVRASEAVQ
jgi:uncharacterized protein